MQQHSDLTNWLARVANQARAGDWEAWGDYAAPKLPGIIRIMFQNVQNLPSFNEHLKNKVLYGTFKDYQVDVYAMNEVGVHWLNVPEKDRLYHRIQSWFERSEISLAYNSTETPESTFQWGGTAVWSVNKMAHQFMQKGSDGTGLGRWSWQRFRGRNGMSLRVVSAYCPQPSGGIYSVPGQHQFYLNKTDDKRTPRDAFWGDLCSAVEAWSAMGDQIILTGDWNEDVRSPSMTERMQQLGLREVLMEKHGSQDAPATGDRGSKPIDGVFASLSLDITQGGYLPFGMGCPSDHRAGWIDVTYEAALGYPMAPLKRPRARRLQNKDPRIVKKYLEYLVAYIIFHKLVEKAVALENTVNYPPTADQIKEYEKLDKLRLEGIAGAERHCRKLRMGEVPWSPQLKGVWQQLYAWDMVIRKKQGRRLSSRFLQRLIATAGIVVPHEYTLTETKLKRQQVFRHYLKEKPKADATRQTFQDGLAEALAQAKDSTKAKQLKQLRSREKQRSAARQSKIVRQKLRAGAVTFVTTVDSTGRKIDVTGKANIERVLNESNYAKYDQTRQTAFMNEPLVTDFNFLGVGDAARKVLDGTYEPPEGTDYYAELFLKHLVQTAEARESAPQAAWLDTATWQKSWASGVREHTSSGPSAMHFGSLMAGAKHDLVAELDAIMTNIPLISGYSPTRWCKAIDAMLLKKQGLYLLNKLRTIVLFEPDFNWMNKMLGWAMMTFAESNNQLAPEQYGSRKYHKAIDQVVNKILTFDILRQLRWPGALCSNDAKSCYDRIVHAVASLCMQRNNIAEPAIVCMFSTIQKLEHTIRTAYGDSTSTYTGPLWAIPLQGVMQGNGAGPAIWAIVSSPVLDMLRSEGFGTFFHTSITGEEVRFVGYSFVDDTDLVQTAKGEEDSIASIVELMQEAVNTWEGGIRATGGAIATDKSYWYPIAFIWEKGHWRLATQAETPFEISVLDHTGRRVVLDKLGPDETKETLGTYVAPSGTMDDQMENMLAASKKWADQIRAGRLNKTDAWLALKTTIWKTLEYPLPALTLTYQQCESIMRPAVRAGLNASGMCSNFPRAVVFGTETYQGLGLHHLYTLMCISHIEDMITHGHQNTITGHLYRASIEQLLVEAGVGVDIFDWDYQRFKDAITKGLAQHTWKFLSESGLYFKLSGIVMPLRRKHDCYLMQIFARKYKAPTLAKLNRFRLFLRVTTLADITTGDGKALAEAALAGNRDDTRPHYYTWPVQQRPPSQELTTWIKALHECFTNHSKLLNTPLGEWTDEDTTWNWFYDEAEQRLFERLGNGWRLWIPTNRRQQRCSTQRFLPAARISVIPGTAQRSTVFRSGPFIRLSGISPTRPRTTTPPAASLADQITTLPAQQQWSMQEVTNDDDGVTLASAIMRGTAVAVSDGSYKDEYGTSAWVIQSSDEKGEARGVNVVPGNPRDQSAYRSELAGIHGVVSYVNQLCAYHDISEGSVEVGCDGFAALRSVFEPRFIHSRVRHFDLITSIRRLLQDSPVLWKHRHVKGHQDDKIPHEYLDRWARLNVEVDLRAKVYWIEAQEAQLTPLQTFEGEPWSIWIDGRKLCQDIKAQLYEAVHAPKTKTYWTKRKRPRMSSETYDTIDWLATQKAMKAAPLSRRIWISKHTSGVCAVGRNAKRWRVRDTDKCPRCGEPNETAGHVWRCRHPDAITKWNGAVDKLGDTLQKLHTHSDVIEVIKRRLHEWKTYKPFSPVISTFPGLKETVANQDSIGWHHFLEGALVTGWQDVQAVYYQCIKSRRTSLRWISALIRKLWDVAWDQWEHRNGVLHNNENFVTIDEVASVELQVRREFDTGKGPLPTTDSHLFKGTVDRIIKQSLFYKRKWLTHVEVARNRHHRRVQASWPKERIIMRRWLRLNIQK